MMRRMRESVTSTFGVVTPAARRILTGNLISAVGSGVTLPFFIIYLGEVRGLGIATAGLLVAFLSIVTLVATPGVGALVDRWGPRPVLMAGLVITAVSVGSLGWVASVPAAVIVLIVLGIGDAALWAPQSALYARVTPRQDRQKLFGLQFMCLNLGLSVGGMLGAVIANVADPSSFVLLYLLDAATFVVYLAILIPMRGVGVGPAREQSDAAADDAPQGRSSSGYREVLRDRAVVRLAVASIFLLTFGYGSLEVGLPVYITQVAGLDLSMVGWAYAVNAGAIVIGQLFVLSLIQGRSRSLLGGLVGLLWAVSWVAIGAAAHVPVAAAVVAVLVGMLVFAFGETIWSPVAPAIANDLAPDHLRGRYNALLSWSWAFSGVLGPGVTGLLLGAGHDVAWLIVIVAGLVIAAVLLVSLRRVLTPEQDGRS